MEMIKRPCRGASQRKNYLMETLHVAESEIVNAESGSDGRRPEAATDDRTLRRPLTENRER